MYETKEFTIPEATREKLLYLSTVFQNLNTGNTSGEFWIAIGGTSESYDWSQFEIGINNTQQLITCSQSGCSCNGPEHPTGDSKYELGKEVVIKGGDYDTQEIEEAVADLIKTTDTLYDLFQKKDVATEEIIALPNAEIRRAAIEYIGYEAFMAKAAAKKLDENNDHGILYQVPLKDDEDLVLLKVKDPSTDRQYFLRVPPEMKTAGQARAWTFGFREQDFVLTKET